ncbi:MAG: ABC transporter permease [Lachnospirales bacterium]
MSRIISLLGYSFITLKDIFLSRKLVLSLAGKDFKRRFAGSYFGIFWAFLNPILTIIVYSMVFTYAFKAPYVGNVSFLVWFITGIIPWLFISEALFTTSASLLEYSYLIKKVSFNVNVIPLIKIMSSFFIHLFFVLILVLLILVMGYSPNIYIVQLPYYMFCTVFFLYCFGLFASSITVLFRDFSQIISILILIGMWGSPISWDINIFPENIQFFLKLNPLVYIIEGYRDCIFNEVWFFQKYNLSVYFWLVNIMLFLLGNFVFRRLKPHFSDVL